MHFAVEIPIQINVRTIHGFNDDAYAFLSKLHEKDEMTEFSKNRVKELKDYLEQLNASK